MAEGDGEQIDWLNDEVEAVRRIHHEVLVESGGKDGENTDRLLAAVARPFQAAFDTTFYPTDIDKAGALFHGIICDHCFVDGSKRTATMSAIHYLVGRGYLGRDPSKLQVRLLGDVALEAALPSGLTAEQVIFWFHRILDDA